MRGHSQRQHHREDTPQQLSSPGAPAMHRRQGAGSRWPSENLCFERDDGPVEREEQDGERSSGGERNDDGQWCFTMVRSGPFGFVSKPGDEHNRQKIGSVQYGAGDDRKNRDVVIRLECAGKNSKRPAPSSRKK